VNRRKGVCSDGHVPTVNNESAVHEVIVEETGSPLQRDSTQATLEIEIAQ
jgi:hypothetical protein